MKKLLALASLSFVAACHQSNGASQAKSIEKGGEVLMQCSMNSLDFNTSYAIRGTNLARNTTIEFVEHDDGFSPIKVLMPILDADGKQIGTIYGDKYLQVEVDESRNSVTVSREGKGVVGKMNLSSCEETTRAND